jgi:hypothetical protein
VKYLTIVTIFSLLMISSAQAETDGNDVLELMQRKSSRPAVQPYIDAVWQKWNNGLFCIPEENIQDATYDAVKAFLENNPDVLFRPRRYVITNALMQAFPCKKD